MELRKEVEKETRPLNKEYHCYSCQKNSKKPLSLTEQTGDQTIYCRFCGSDFVQEIHGLNDPQIIQPEDIPEFKVELSSGSLLFAAAPLFVCLASIAVCLSPN